MADGSNLLMARARKKWWQLGHPSKGAAGVVFSAMDEMFHGTAKHAQEIREQQKRQAVELFDNEDGKNRITIDVPKTRNSAFDEC